MRENDGPKRVGADVDAREIFERRDDAVGSMAISVRVVVRVDGMSRRILEHGLDRRDDFVRLRADKPERPCRDALRLFWVLSRATKTGTPSAGASSWMPPESVRMAVAFDINRANCA